MVVCVVPLCHSLIFPVHLRLSPCQVMHGIHFQLSRSFLTPTHLLQQLKCFNTYPAHLPLLWGCETMHFMLMGTTARCRKHRRQYLIRKILNRPTCLSLGCLHPAAPPDIPNWSRGKSSHQKTVRLSARDARAHSLGNMILNDTHVCIRAIDPTYVECVRRASREAMRCGDIFVLSVTRTNLILLPRHLMCWSCRNEILLL